MITQPSFTRPTSGSSALPPFNPQSLIESSRSLRRSIVDIGSFSRVRSRVFSPIPQLVRFQGKTAFHSAVAAETAKIERAAAAAYSISATPSEAMTAPGTKKSLTSASVVPVCTVAPPNRPQGMGRPQVTPSPVPEPNNRLLALGKSLPASMKRTSWSLADFNVTAKLCSTNSSRVYKATCKISSLPVALKVYSLDKLSPLHRHQIYREVRLHASLQHPNIIDFYAAFEDKSFLIVVQELAESGDLHTFFNKYGTLFSERRVVEMVRPLLQALHALHKSGIIHRDIKLENILLTKEKVIKLADFGLAINTNEEPPVTRAGTTDYMAPEIFQCPLKSRPGDNKNKTNLYYDSSVDVWSIGVLVYELVVGKSPFTGITERKTIENIMKTQTSGVKLPSQLSESCKSFILNALNRISSERPTVDGLLSSAWFEAHPIKKAQRFVRSETARLSELPSSLLHANSILTSQSLPLPLLTVLRP